MSELEKQKDFAIIHNTPKGQILITKEPNGDEIEISYWIMMDFGMVKIVMKTNSEEKADRNFEQFRNYEIAKEIVNEILKQEYL